MVLAPLDHTPLKTVCFITLALEEEGKFFRDITLGTDKEDGPLMREGNAKGENIREFIIGNIDRVRHVTNFIGETPPSVHNEWIFFSQKTLNLLRSDTGSLLKIVCFQLPETVLRHLLFKEFWSALLDI